MREVMQIFFPEVGDNIFVSGKRKLRPGDVIDEGQGWVFVRNTKIENVWFSEFFVQPTKSKGRSKLSFVIKAGGGLMDTSLLGQNFNATQEDLRKKDLDRRTHA